MIINKQGKFKFKTLSLAVVAASMALASVQPVAVAEEGASDRMEEVLVTGSRIKRPGTDTLSPTVSFDNDYMKSKGFINLGDAIADASFFSQTGITDADFNTDSSDIGFAFVDLFGLGTGRTLTVIDGKRTVGSASPSPGGSNGLQVDVSAIPTSLVERVETISIGGAPIYGADAIAGTVNVILKDRFEGYEVDAQYGETAESDAENYKVSFLGGTNFNEDKGNITFWVERQERDGLPRNARPGSSTLQLNNPTFPFSDFILTVQEDIAFPTVSQFGTPVWSADVDALLLGGFIGLLNSPLIAPVPDITTGELVGSQKLGFIGSNLLIDPFADPLMFGANGRLTTVPLGDATGTLLATANQPDFPGLYREDDYLSLLNESERTIFGSTVTFDFNDRLTGKLRFMYSELIAKRGVGSPSISGISTPLLTIDLANPFLHSADRATIGADQAFYTGLFGLPAPTNFRLGRAHTDLMGPGNEGESENFSIVGSLEGQFEFADRTFNWDATASYGRAETTNTQYGINAARFALAQDVIVRDAGGAIIGGTTNEFADAFSFDAAAGGYVDSSTGETIVCASGGNCLPFNPFGQQNPREVAAYLIQAATQETEITQSYIQANLGTDLFKLPAGAVQVVAGFEYRKEEASYKPDAVSLNGDLLGGLMAQAVDGDFSSTELYAETLVPLISGGVVDSLEFEGAVRYIDNDTNGSDETWTAGLRLALTDDILFRGNRTRSVRSPSITELFSGSVPVFTGVTDPCSVGLNSSGNNPATRQANCLAAVAAAGVTAPGTEQAFLDALFSPLGGVVGSTSGNQGLDNEVADSWTFGVVLTPRFIEGFIWALDWNNIEIEDAIGLRTGSQLLNDCYDSPNFPQVAACNQFTRDPATFVVDGYAGTFLNAGFLNFAALTSDMTYQFDLGPGVMGLNFTAIYLDEFEFSSDGLVSQDQTDTFGREEFKAKFGISYSVKNLSILWDTNYFSDTYLDFGAKEVPDFQEYREISEYYLHDLFVAYQVTDNLSVRLVVNNVLDEQPIKNVRQSGPDRLGRRGVIGVNYRF